MAPRVTTKKTKFPPENVDRDTLLLKLEILDQTLVSQIYTAESVTWLLSHLVIHKTTESISQPLSH